MANGGRSNSDKPTPVNADKSWEEAPKAFGSTASVAKQAAGDNGLAAAHLRGTGRGRRDTRGLPKAWGGGRGNGRTRRNELRLRAQAGRAVHDARSHQVCTAEQPACCRIRKSYACRAKCLGGEKLLVVKSHGHSMVSKGCNAPAPKAATMALTRGQLDAIGRPRFMFAHAKHTKDPKGQRKNESVAVR